MFTLIHAISPRTLSLMAVSLSCIVLILLACLLLWRRHPRPLGSEALDPKVLLAIQQTALTLADVQRRQERSEALLNALSQKIESAVLTPGLVHFSAYDAGGPRLSFALALLTRGGDGMVLASLYGRTDARVYAKRLVRGRPSVELSPEEAEAVNLALNGGGAAVWEDQDPPSKPNP